MSKITDNTQISDLLQNGMAAIDMEEIVPSDTLKRHPKMDLNRNDLLKLLSYLEGELQARDLSIAALKAEKASQVLYQAKYGRFGLGDAFFALQRDAEDQHDKRHDEVVVKLMYENQLSQLENLISTQRSAHLKMQAQLVSVEKRYHKVCTHLDDEKRKHAQDTAQGDDVTYMLEKERERLKQELEFEKNHAKKMEREVTKLHGALEKEKLLTLKHKQVSLLLIKERKQWLTHYNELKLKNLMLQKLLFGNVSKDTANSPSQFKENSAAMVPYVTDCLESEVSKFDHHTLKAMSNKKESNEKVIFDTESAVPVSAVLKNKKIENADVVADVTAETIVANPFSAIEQGVSTTLSDETVDFSQKVANFSLDSSSALNSADITVKNDLRQLPGQGEVIHAQLHRKPVGETIDPPTVCPQYGSRPSSERKMTGTRIYLNSGAVLACSRKSASPGRGTPPPVPPNKPQISLPSLQSNALKLCNNEFKEKDAMHHMSRFDKGITANTITPVSSPEPAVYMMNQNKDINQSHYADSQNRNSVVSHDKDIRHQSSEIYST